MKKRPPPGGPNEMLSEAKGARLAHRTRVMKGRKPAAPVVSAEVETLLANVLAMPDDDAPRLVYADYLQERGDPRGEFIAVQCELARLGPDATGARVEELRARETDLLKKHKKKWVGSFKGTRTETTVGAYTWVKGSPTRWVFERGFVRDVTMRTTEFAKNAEALFACEPVRRLHVSDRAIAAFVKHCPRLERLRELDLSRVLLLALEARALFGSKRFEALEALELRQCGLAVVTTRASASYFEPKHFPRLRKLGLSDNSLGDNGATALAQSNVLRDITTLDLSRNKIGPTGARALLPRMAGLVSLELRANDLDSSAIIELADGAFPRLAYLGLAANAIDEAAAGALISSGGFPALARLEVSAASVTRPALDTLRARFGTRLHEG